MDSKQFIRLYEELKQRKATTLNEKLKIERDWLELHKNLVRFNKTKKKKKDKTIEPFVKKSLVEAQSISNDIFSILMNDNKSPFTKVLRENEVIYFKRGAKGLVEAFVQKENPGLSLQDITRIQMENQAKNSLSSLDWEKRIEEVIKRTYTTLSEALSIEKECCFLFQWFYQDSTSALKNPTLNAAFNRLEPYYLALGNFLVSTWGYEINLLDLIPTTDNKMFWQNNGFLLTIRELEKTQSTSIPLYASLLENIQLSHPKEKYKRTREMSRHFIIHTGPTNSGKTYHAIQALKQAKKGIYLAPIRLLAFEIQEKLTKVNVLCNLSTGDQSVTVPNATHCSSIIEKAPLQSHDIFDLAVIDEFQMIEDDKRGYAWLHAIFGLQANEIHLCGAPHALPFILSLIDECGDTFEIKQYERQTPLIVEDHPFSFPHSIQKGDALIAFSKREVMHLADELSRIGVKASILYGKLPPHTRQEQLSQFIDGKTDVLVSTDAIGIGLNLPIKRVVFSEMEKFDGEIKRFLTIQEVKQIAGRAGRRGLYDQGFVTSFSERHFFKNHLEATDAQVTESVIRPTSDVLSLMMGTLRQRLYAWKQAPLDVPYLKKADISHQLTLLSIIEEWEHELSLDDVLKTLYIPFDSKERLLVMAWKSYVLELKNKNTRLKRPILKGKTITNMMFYFHHLSLYEQFNKRFFKSSDREWISFEKYKTSKLIEQSLQQRQYRGII